MVTSRRRFLAGGAAAAAGAVLVRRLMAMKQAGDLPALRIGVCDWSFGARGPAAFEKAAAIGLEGVQVSPRAAAETLSYATKAEQDEYLKAVKDTGVQVASLGLTVTNGCPLATDKRGPAWLTQTIDAAAALGAKTTLIAFFSKGSLLDEKTWKLKDRDVDAVVARLKDAAPHAKDKGVILGLESWLSAKDNLAILDRVGSDHVQVYYDIANSTVRGYDVPAEIRALKGRICQFHFKNTKGYFGQDGVKCEPIAEAIRQIGFAGWLVMERSFEKDAAAYFRRNAEHIRKLFGLKAPKP